MAFKLNTADTATIKLNSFLVLQDDPQLLKTEIEDSELVEANFNLILINSLQYTGFSFDAQDIPDGLQTGAKKIEITRFNFDIDNNAYVEGELKTGKSYTHPYNGLSTYQKGVVEEASLKTFILNNFTNAYYLSSPPPGQPKDPVGKIINYTDFINNPNFTEDTEVYDQDVLFSNLNRITNPNKDIILSEQETIRLEFEVINKFPFQNEFKNMAYTRETSTIVTLNGMNLETTPIKFVSENTNFDQLTYSDPQISTISQTITEIFDKNKITFNRVCSINMVDPGAHPNRWAKLGSQFIGFERVYTFGDITLIWSSLDAPSIFN